MKLLSLVLFVALAGFPLAGCKTTFGARTDPEAVQVYQCPSCKETVQWKYHPTKPWVVTGREVVHECPDCKRSWGSNLQAVSNCQLCADAHSQCPMCKKHG